MARRQGNVLTADPTASAGADERGEDRAEDRRDELADEGGEDGPPHRNEVLLVGRVSAEPTERAMPSGDVVLGFRLAVRRDPSSRSSPAGRVVADGLECAAWRPGLRRTIATWKVGDVVQVSGSLHRRVRREDGQTTSRYEIEVGAARRLKRISR